MTSKGTEKMSEIAIGVDISKDTLDAHRLPDGTSRGFPNTAAGHKALIAWIGPRVARIVFEPTGPYHAAFEQALVRSGLPIVKVNPQRSRTCTVTCDSFPGQPCVKTGTSFHRTISARSRRLRLALYLKQFDLLQQSAITRFASVRCFKRELRLRSVLTHWYARHDPTGQKMAIRMIDPHPAMARFAECAGTW
jgi:hypothetical protein